MKRNHPQRVSPGGVASRPKAATARIDEIVATGLALTKTVPLQDVSIVRIARELDVTPGSIHYYVDGRDSLTSKIISRFYDDLLRTWPAETADWTHDLRSIASAIQQHFKRYPGIAAYYVLHNRFDVLIPAMRTQEGEVAVEFIEKYLTALGRVGLSAQRTATYAVILLQFIHVTAHASAQHQWPSEHSALKIQVDRYSQKEFPSLRRFGDAFVKVSGVAAFSSGLDLIVAGLTMEAACATKKPA